MPCKLCHRANFRSTRKDHALWMKEFDGANTQKGTFHESLDSLLLLELGSQSKVEYAWVEVAEVLGFTLDHTRFPRSALNLQEFRE